jgi:hypothetical protein
VLVSTLVILLSQQEETVLISLKHLLILALLQQLSHQLGHHDLVLFDAIVIVLGSPSGCDLSLRPSGHHRDHCLYSLKQDCIVIRMSDLKTFQKALDDI